MSFSAKKWTRALAGAMVASGLLAGSALAQEAEDAAAEVVAVVDGQEITTADLGQIAGEFSQQLQSLPPEQRSDLLVNLMIEIRLMARAAEKDGLADRPDVARRVANHRDRVLRSEYLRANLFETLNDEMVQAQFEKDLAGFQPREERRARHILVATEEEALAIIEQLNDGGDFAEIAMEKSTDPGSGRNGGDLGFFSKGAMVPTFENATFEMEIGDVTEAPVQSQFGWHIIKLEEIRDEPAPTLEERTPAIRQKLMRDGLTALSEKLRADATIEVMGPDGELVPQE